MNGVVGRVTSSRSSRSAVAFIQGNKRRMWGHIERVSASFALLLFGMTKFVPWRLIRLCRVVSLKLSCYLVLEALQLGSGVRCTVIVNYCPVPARFRGEFPLVFVLGGGL